MNEPSFDKDGYPTEETLREIREWPSGRGYGALMEFVHETWKHRDYIWSTGATWKVSTVGWSGNEDIIGALEQNRTFWAVCWQRSERGGHYLFVIPEHLQEAKRP